MAMTRIHVRRALPCLRQVVRLFQIRTEVLGVFDEVCRIVAPSREIRNDDEYLARNNRDCSDDNAVVLAGVYRTSWLAVGAQLKATILWLEIWIEEKVRKKQVERDVLYQSPRMSIMRVITNHV